MALPSLLQNLVDPVRVRLGVVLRKCWRACRFYKNLIFFILFPLLCSPLLFEVGDAAKAAQCGFVVLVMGSFWAFNVIPMPMTALIPALGYPLFRIAESNAICQLYMTSNNMLFIGGLMISVAIEETRLHERVALRTLMVFGTKPRWLMAGLMSVAAVLSMWISNTATTAMLLPIAQGVCVELAQKVPHAHRIRSLGSVRRRTRRTAANGDDIESGRKKLAVRENPKISMSLVPLLGDVHPHLSPPAAGSGGGARNPGLKSPASRRADDPFSAETEQIAPATRETTTIVNLPQHRRPLRPQMSVGNFVQTPDNNDELEVPVNSARLRAILHTYPPALQSLFGGLMLCIAYASNIGGIATLIGTPTNLIFKSLLDQEYGAQLVAAGGGGGVNFANFMVFGVPCALCSLVLCWLYMQWVYCCGGFGRLWSKISRQLEGGNNKQPARQSSLYGREFAYNINDAEISLDILQQRYAQLGPINWAEGSTSMFFVLLFVAWIMRQPGFVPGWGDTRGFAQYVNDAQPAVLIAILLFIWPFHKPSWSAFRDAPAESETSTTNRKSYRALLNWRTVEANFPWGVLLLLGGGAAMASGVKSSGLGRAMSGVLSTASVTLPSWVVVVLIGVTVSLVTEIVSNTAATTVAVPILFQLAKSANQNPIYFALPAAVASSFAFMLPVATPPNAIVFSCGWLKLSEMIKVGWVINLLCTAVLVGCMHTVGALAFDVLNEPEWARLSGIVNATHQLALNYTTTTTTARPL